MQGIEFVNPVLERGPGQDEGVPAPQPLDGLRGLGGPVLDPLRLVQHHHIRAQPLVDLQGVGAHLLVVDDGEKRGPGIGPKPRLSAAEHELVGQRREALDLFLPLGLQRGRRHHQHPLDLPQAVQQRAGGDGLNGLAQTHFVGQKNIVSF